MEQKQSQPSYYANIPADVRYSKELSANAKLLYGEITALANKEAYCWASNKYFAELYGVSISTASRWVSELEKAGFITVKVDKNYLRKIAMGATQKQQGGYAKSARGATQKAQDNTTKNNTSNNTKNTAQVPDDRKALAELLKEQILERYPNNVGAKATGATARWAKDIDLMMRIDKRTYEEIRGCILWAFQIDDFWHRQIWSGANLRKHFDKMTAQAQSDLPKIKVKRKAQLSHELAMDKISIEQYDFAMAQLDAIA